LVEFKGKQMTDYNEIQDDHYPAILTEQLNPFGANSDIDYVVEDEASYYAMADDIDSGKNEHI